MTHMARDQRKKCTVSYTLSTPFLAQFTADVILTSLACEQRWPNLTIDRPSLKWILCPEDREELLAVFVPHFPIVLGLHLENDDTNEEEGSEQEGVIVGHAENPADYQCLIVSTQDTIYSRRGQMKTLVWSLSRYSLYGPSNPPTITHWDPLPVIVPVRLRLERAWERPTQR